MTTTLEAKNVGTPLVTDKDRGIVTAVVSTFDQLDLDAEVVLKDAIREGARLKISESGHSSIYGSLPVGRGVVHVKYPHVILVGQYFMDVARARDAFLTVKALGEDAEWSLGFHVLREAPMTEFWRERGAKRLFSELKLYEVSLVLAGASPGTHTVSAKRTPESADERAAREQWEQFERTRWSADAAREAARFAQICASAR
jgi:hypothetical protein